MFWADRVVQEIIKSGKFKPYWVDDMKTPSGRIHVGSLRGVVVHDLVYRSLLDAGVKTKFTYVFEDHDPMDALPHYLDKNTWSQYLGKPLFMIPSPVEGFKNYAQYYALEFKEVFNKIGSHPEIIWTSQLYLDGKMNDDIRICLDNVSKIKKIYEKIYHKTLPKDWFPFQVVCPSCGKESTTKVSAWNGEKVSFSCKVDAVDWTNGCGFYGKTSPFSNKGKYAGKLPWKVEWAVKWKVIGVTVEGAGKDHMSAGGSHDIASGICREVVDYPVPYPVGYEFFLIGGKKMSSSKGLGTSALEASEMLPPYLLRFLMVRTQIQQAINFDPKGWSIPDLFDEYDRCWHAFLEKTDLDLSRMFELSQITGRFFKKNIFIPRFRQICQLIQFPNVNVEIYFTKEKGSKLTKEESTLLIERVKYAQSWLKKYAPEEAIFIAKDSLPPQVKNLTRQQKEYLGKIIPFIKSDPNPEKLQLDLYETAKKIKIPIKEAFNAIYLAFLGKNYGPKAAWLLCHLSRDFVIARIKEAIFVNLQDVVEKKFIFPLIKRPDLFVIEKELADKYPSLNIGIAIIKDVTVKKIDKNLQNEITDLITKMTGLTTEKLSHFKEIQSYRKLYKEMGIDWHSRRPSPEALLRRIALKKGLYSVNTCVDSYNLVVMKNRVSSGAFDFDKIKFPTILRFSKKGEKIHLLGDNVETEYQEGEIAYFDQVGGFNIDFNFRDAQRTMVSLKTRNLWINIDGVYDISREQIEKTLRETIDTILKYCGGKVELSGIVSAK